MLTALWLWLLALFGRRMVIPAMDPPSSNSSSSPQPKDAEDAQAPQQAAPDTGDPPWLALARQEDGTREIAGPRNNPKILQYFKDVGHPEIVDDETAWCAAFHGAMLERSGYPSTKSLAARSYLRWGKECDPCLGATVVLKRAQDNGTQGHVGFYVGEDHDSVFVLGGNQWNPLSGRSEIVNVSKFPKSRVLGYRWPVTLTNSRTVQGGALALTGEVVDQTSKALPDDLPTVLQQTGQQLQGLAEIKWWIGTIGTVLILAGVVWMLYARFDDLHNKGR